MTCTVHIYADDLGCEACAKAREVRQRSFAPAYRDKTEINPHGIRVYYGRDEVRPRSVDHVRTLGQNKLTTLLAFDTENYGRLLYDVPLHFAKITVDSAGEAWLQIPPMQPFTVVADDLVLVKSLRLSVLRDGEYFYPLELSGQKQILEIAIAKGARVIVEPPKETAFKVGTYRLVLEAPHA